MAIDLHACSVCQNHHGWGLAYSAFNVITIHFGLAGQGALRVGTGPVLSFTARSALIVPAHQPHVLSELGPGVQLVQADEHCSLLGDGLVSFTARARLVRLLRAPLIQDFSADPGVSPVFDLCRACIPAMAEAGWGRIILFGSEDAQQPYTEELPYCASKAAILNLSKGLLKATVGGARW